MSSKVKFKNYGHVFTIECTQLFNSVLEKKRRLNQMNTNFSTFDKYM